MYLFRAAWAIECGAPAAGWRRAAPHALPPCPHSPQAPLSLADGGDCGQDAGYAVNVRGVLVVSQLLAKGMVERGSGSIVNVSSQSSLRVLQDHTT